ncbi:MAG: LD-carboxypeptidase [Marinifilaceae bacterium]|nr:LD-carboxypeptidase [Marinifilaceae bacterium]
MISPNFLKPGDTIGIVSPAGKIKKEFILNAKDILISWGYKVEIGKNAANDFNYYAGTDEERADDLQKMLDDKKIKAILCSRGGYGCIRIIPKLNFKKFLKNPKWLIGFSDISILHSHINSNLSIKTIHSKMAINFPSSGVQDQTTEMIRHILQGGNYDIQTPANTYCKEGKVQATLIGGNLSVINCILSTKYSIDTTNKILLLEEVGENLHHLDRMMNHFYLSGKFNNLAGIVIGSFSEMKEKAPGFGKEAYAIISEYTSKLDIPVAFGFDIGHITNNNPVILGAEHILEVNNDICKLSLV